MRTTAALVAGAGVSLAAYVVARPWGPGDTPQGWAAASWPVTHALAMLGFVLLAAASQRLAAARPARGVVPLAWATVGLLLPYYGAEAFALHAIGTTGVANSAEVATAIRFGPIQAVAFLAGWVALAALGIVLVVAVTRGTTDRVLRVGTWALAAGLALYFPVFYLPPAGRVTHGVLVAVAALVTAWRLRRA